MIDYLKKTFAEGPCRLIKCRKVDGINKPLQLHKQFLQKNSNASIFPIGSCCQTMADTSFFSIGCMKRQHAVFLESIWETDSIITHFPASRTGLLTPLLTCFTLLSFSLLPGQIILSPSPFLPFLFWTKIF